MACFDHPSRDPNGGAIRGDIVDNHGSGTNDRMSANSFSRNDHNTSPKKSPFFNGYISRKIATGGNLGEIVNNIIMIYSRTSVDYGIGP